jgi:hypothetical protein
MVVALTACPYTTFLFTTIIPAWSGAFKKFDFI